jgi:uncharacterized protein (DUF1697 family)
MNTYICMLRGINVSGQSNMFFEMKLGVAATTRNWKTVNTLPKMRASDISFHK